MKLRRVRNGFIGVRRVSTFGFAPRISHECLMWNLFNRLLQPAKPPRLFVLLFQGRSGSTHVIDHLASHQQVEAGMEPLTDRSATWAAQQQIVERLLDAHPSHQIRARGFKTKLDDLRDLAAFRKILHDRGVNVIHLYRSNIVKLAVSIIRARHLRALHGDSNVKRSDQVLPPSRIEIDEFRRALVRTRRYAALKRYVDTLECPRLDLTYESLLEHESATLGEVFEFLGVDAQPTSSRYLKNTPDDLRETVLNLNELRDAFPDLEDHFVS